MTNPDQLSGIIERILAGSITDGDRQTLQNWVQAGTQGQIVQIGKYNVNIGEGKDIQIGDRIYQGADAEAIKGALRAVLQERLGSDRPANEYALLRSVKQQKVLPRLVDSLHNAILINLGKEQRSQQVDCPWDAEIKIGSKPAEPIPAETTFLELFDRPDIAGRLLILGAPGSGKTTMLLELAQSLLERAEQQANYPIPVWFNLSSWQGTGKSLQDWLIARLNLDYGVREDIGQDWFNQRRLLPLLDGLDEVRPQHQQACIQAINQLLSGENNPAYLVVCCRSQEYAQFQTRLTLNGAICLQPLTHCQIKRYLEQTNCDSVTPNVLSDPLLLDLLKTPLFLSMTVLAYQGMALNQWQAMASQEQKLEYLFQVFLQQVLARPSYRYYSPKQQPRPKQTRRWLIWLARYLQKQSQPDFLIEKLQPDCLQGAEKTQYQLLLGSIGLLFVVGPIYFIIMQTFGMSLWGSLIMLVGLGIGITLDWYREIKPVETLRLSFQNSRQRLQIALRNGGIYGVIGAAIGALAAGPAGGLAGGLIGGISAGTIGWLDRGLIGPEIDIKIRPNEGMHRSIQNAGIVALITSFVFAIAAITSKQINVVIATALLGAMSGWVIGGGLACIQHLALRLVLWWHGYIPWNYARFLNDANERLILQRTGARFQFIHILLRDYLIRQPK